MILFLIAYFITLLFCLTKTTEQFSPSDCTIQCRAQNNTIVDPQSCCECRTSGGYITGPADTFNEPFRKCMCSFGTGYESYCMKLSTNFLLSQ